MAYPKTVITRYIRSPCSSRFSAQLDNNRENMFPSPRLRIENYYKENNINTCIILHYIHLTQSKLLLSTSFLFFHHKVSYCDKF